MAGFTLIEVLAALAVVAVALSSTIHAAGQFASHSAYLRDKTFAMWVAQDRILEWQTLGTLDGLGTYAGQSLMGNKSWHWSAEVIRTAMPGMRRVDVEVRSQEQDQNPLVRLSALLQQKGG